MAIFSVFLAICCALLLVFKYTSQKEKRELKIQRDKQFKEVERLLKKGDEDSIKQVIQIFDSLEQLSDKLGDFGLVNELRERSNNLRRQLGLEAKGDLGIPVQEINKFIQKLMRGPYGKGTVIELAIPESASPGTEVSAAPKSLLEEGAEILARLRSIRGEGVEEKPTVLFPTAQLGGKENPSTSSTTPAESSSLGEAPPVIKLPFPVPSQKIRVSASPKAPPAELSSPVSEEPPPFAARPPPPLRPIAIPIENPTTPPLAAPSKHSSPKEPPPFAARPPPSPRPIAIPIGNQDIPARISEEAIPAEIEEPQILDIQRPIESRIEEPQASDEKGELIARLKQELPLLPENEKNNILEELMKRPAGKLRETWFKIIVHKNKQYATE